MLMLYVDLLYSSYIFNFTYNYACVISQLMTQFYTEKGAEHERL